jgi:hypothetical protein
MSSISNPSSDNSKFKSDHWISVAIRNSSFATGQKLLISLADLDFLNDSIQLAFDSIKTAASNSCEKDIDCVRVHDELASQ